MSNVIKCIGIALGTGVLLCVLFFLGFFVLLGYEIFGASNIEYYRGKFLLTATVEVDGNIKTGSSVYEVSYNRRTHGGGQGLQISPINGARGTMPMIDLGKYGTLMFTFLKGGGFPYIPGNLKLKKPPKCYSSSAQSFPTAVMVEKTKGFNFRDYVDAIIDKEGVFNARDITLPVYLVKDHYADGELNYFDFCNIGLVTNGKIKPISITIQHTDLPLQLKNPYPKKLEWTRSWSNEF